MSSKKKSTQPAPAGGFDSLVTSIVHLHQQTQDFATKAVNVALTLRNWLIGCRIVEFEQQGKDRAAYGERLLPALAERLSAAGLKRVDVRELRRFRLLYEVYPQIRETLTPELLDSLGSGALRSPLNALPQPKRESVTPESQIEVTMSPKLIQRLSFTHLVELIQLPDNNDGTGFIWLTTGSGKTLTSFKPSTLLKENDHIHKCVVDRKDLDRQTREDWSSSEKTSYRGEAQGVSACSANQFNKFQEGCVEENTNTAAIVRRKTSVRRQSAVPLRQNSNN